LLVSAADLGVLSLPLHAQQAKAPKFFYEGQKVALVELVGRPPIDVEPLRGLLLQKAGESYSNEKVQSTIDALNGTRRFSKVDVEVTPGTDGLKILFILQPAYYIGMIYFPGADKTFPYSRLLGIVNYPRKRRMTKVASRRQYRRRAVFREQRIFHSSGTKRTQLMKHHWRMSVSRHLNKRAKFGAVEIDGLPESEQEHLRSSFRSLSARLRGASLIPGKRYDLDRLRAAAARIRSHLSKKNLPASQIRRAPPIYHPETNRADITFQVTPGPTVDVRTSGVRISQGQLQKLIPIYEENAFDEELVEEGKRNLVNHFQKKGYFNVKVESRIEHASSQISLVYAIDRGNKHRVEVDERVSIWRDRSEGSGVVKEGDSYRTASSTRTYEQEFRIYRHLPQCRFCRR
jgi:outer membrane protein assembly factor BamA